MFYNLIVVVSFEKKKRACTREIKTKLEPITEKV
jgi:hypothetical protein